MATPLGTLAFVLPLFSLVLIFDLVSFEVLGIGYQFLGSPGLIWEVPLLSVRLVGFDLGAFGSFSIVFCIITELSLTVALTS